MSELKTYEDLTPEERGETVGCFLSDLNPHARKAEPADPHDASARMYQIRCRECREPTWTWSAKEDTCEHCMYLLRERRNELAAKNQTVQPPAVNPFSGQNGRGNVPVFSEDGEGARTVNPYAEAPQRRIPAQLNESGAPRIPNPFKT